MSIEIDDLSKLWNLETLHQRDQLLRGYSGMHIVCDCGRLEPECRCAAPAERSLWRRLLGRKA